MADIRHSTAAYEHWLRRQLGDQIVQKDLERKHKKMAKNAFTFLRATYWRWAETVLDVCPEAGDAPQVLAVGDTHLENFGTWRDADGRLVWGVNDFDEAAEMPYVLDLIRLAASALVAAGGAPAKAKEHCTSLLAGYREGIENPRPVVLDRDFSRLRALVSVSEGSRTKFWKKIEEAPSQAAPPRYRRALAAAMPEPGLTIVTSRREAGAGSLGRPRWLGKAAWRGAPVVREAKALVPSAWTLAHGRAQAAIRCTEIAAGRHRAADPWYRVADGIAVRRLSPNNRKIEAEDEGAALLTPQMLHAMGLELANVHLGTGDHCAAIRRDLNARKRGWLLAAAQAMAATIKREHAEWKAIGPSAGAAATKAKK